MLAADLPPESEIVEVGQGMRMGPEELNRLRWQCRRGLLELDLLLERFLEKHGARLQGEQLTSFKALLEHTDIDLLDLIHARSECSDKRLAEVLGWMRSS
jgi:antitoxin CptB